MLSSVLATLALAASISNVAATPIALAARGYAQDADLLEDYTGYHVRYLALNCQSQHNTDFFEACCHPLLRWQNLADRPAQCIPSAGASASAAQAAPTSPTIDEDPLPDYDDDCDDETPSVTSSIVSSTPYATPEPTPYSSTPEPTSYYESSTTSSEPPAPTTTPPVGGDDGAITGGFATFFTQGGTAGACGTVHDDYDLVVAADYRRYGDLGKQSDLCGKKVLITNTNNGKTVTAVIADACPTCLNENCLDLSLGAFDKLATREEGQVPISWKFV